MYAKVATPAIITQEWLDKAFLPLRKYLDARYPEDDAEHTIGYLMFMGNENEQFHYKNRITRSYIVFNQAGEVVYCTEDALHTCI